MVVTHKNSCDLSPSLLLFKKKYTEPLKAFMLTLIGCYMISKYVSKQ